MIRVIYRWQVARENIKAFTETWRKTTNHIHDSVVGAQGSFMLKSVDSDLDVVTIAKWDSLAAWKAFWENENPQEMQGMRELGERVSVEIFEEVENHTR